MRSILVALLLALAGCQLDELTLGGTIVSVVEAERDESPSEESSKHYEDPLVPEVAWQVEVRLDGGTDVTVIHSGPRHYAPGDRVLLLVDDDGALLL